MVTLVLLNGGIGSRIGAPKPKQLIRLKGIPIFIYTLRVVDKLEQITNIIMNYPEGWKEKFEQLVEQYAISTPITYVKAGMTRQESVHLMVREVQTETVIVHEAARPMVRKKNFKKLLKHPSENVTPTLPIPFTVLELDTEKKCISKNLDRSLLANIQLPQKFSTKTLLEAHNRAISDKKVFTEDASAVLASGNKVSVIKGVEENIKITTLLDLQFADYLKSSKGDILDEG